MNLKADTEYIFKTGSTISDDGTIPLKQTQEIVRCKDCRYCDPENKHCDHPMGTLAPFPRKDDDFCSYGERKGGDE